MYSVIRSYNPTWPELLAFFGLAVLSAVAFCITWLALFYTAVAGTALVAAKVLATTVRIEDGGNSSGQRPRMAYRTR